MSDKLLLKAAVTVVEMARMVGMSRARFYQLQKAGVFPQPRMNPSTNRPFFDEELQKVCLEVRQRSIGVNGQVVLFYGRRQESAPTNRKMKKASPKKERHGGLVEAVKSLGLTTTPAEVERAVMELFGGRTHDRDEGEVIRTVFLHLKKRKESAR